MDISRFINPAVKNAPKDETGIIRDLIDKIGASGEKIINMDLGRPNFDSPASVAEKAIEAIQDGKFHYTSLNGIPELKLAIAQETEAKISRPIDPDDNVIVTVGASEALFNIWLNFLKPGDEVLIPTPAYVAYVYILSCLGIKAVEVPIVKDGQVGFDIKDFEDKFTDRTRMIVINTPQNPTGMVFNKDQLEDIADFAKANDLLVVSDECYDNFLFSGEHISIASLPDMWDRTFIVNSVSKTYSMTGWRVGYVVAPKAFIDIMATSHGHLILCATSFAQYGAVEAIKNVKDEVVAMKEEFLRRRALVTKWMDKIGRFPYVKPEGAFYVFFDVSASGLDGLEFSKRLLEDYKVSTMPGSAYGSDFNNYVRLAYTCNYEDLEEAMKRIYEFSSKLI